MDDNQIKPLLSFVYELTGRDDLAALFYTGIVRSCVDRGMDTFCGVINQFTELANISTKQFIQKLELLQSFGLIAPFKAKNPEFEISQDRFDFDAVQNVFLVQINTEKLAEILASINKTE